MSSAQHAILQRSRRGFTLVELVVSLAIVSILMVAIGSAIVFAGAGIPWDNDPGRPTDAALEVAHDMAADLHFALSFTERSSSAVEFTVPSRDGDAVPETIRYEWSGTAGDPVTREYNGGPEVIVLDSVEDFVLVYFTTDFTKNVPVEVESAEVELISYDSSSSLSELQVQAEKWWGQYFKPTLPVGTIRWEVTRVKFMAREGADFLPTTVELRMSKPDMTPSNIVIADEDLLPSALTAVFQWHELLLSAKYLPPDKGLSLVFKNENGESVRLEHQSSSVTQPDLGLSEGDPAWKPVNTDKALLFYVYGTYTTLGTDDVTRTHLTGIEVEIQTSEEESSEIETAVALLHRPELVE